jgi:hypothetical protein
MRFLRAAITGALAIALLVGASASATTISFALNFEFSGGTPPEGVAPWTTITIDDAADPGGANSVRVTIANVGITDQEFVSEVLLNLAPTLDPTLLAFTAVSTSAVSSVAFSTGVDAFQADGDGKFDIRFGLPPPPGDFAAKFTAGETLVFDLTYGSALSATDFDFGSAPGGGQGTFHAAAQVQGIGPSDADSGWIGPVPEPGLAWLLGLGAVVVLKRRAPR